jgi:hypothetical protein
VGVSRYLTTVGSGFEAEIVLGRLADAGIQAVQQGTLVLGKPAGAAGAQDIYVEDEDFDRAREALRSAESVSEDELVRAEEDDAANARAARSAGADPKTGRPREPGGTAVRKRSVFGRLLRRN